MQASKEEFQSLSQFCNYLNERLIQIQKNIQTHRFQKERIICNQQRCDKIEKIVGSLTDKVKWMQMIVNDGQKINSKIQDKICKLSQKNEKVMKNQQNYYKIQQIKQKFVSTIDFPQLVRRAIQPQIQYALDTVLEVRIVSIQNQMNEIKQTINHVNGFNATNLLKQWQINSIPNQIEQAKVQLRQMKENIQLIHELHNAEIAKIRKQLKKIKKNKSSKSIVKSVIKQNRSYLIKQNHHVFDDYDITSKKIKQHQQSYNSDSSSTRLKPLIFDLQKNIEKLSSYNQKMSQKKLKGQFYIGSNKKSKEKPRKSSSKSKISQQVAGRKNKGINKLKEGSQNTLRIQQLLNKRKKFKSL